MTSKNVLNACNEAGMITPCSSDYWKDGNCVKTNHIFDELSLDICSRGSTYKCQALQDLFGYMKHSWNSGAAYGIVANSGVSGNGYSNKWSLCARKN